MGRTTSRQRGRKETARRISRQLRLGSLFAGIGGFDLAAKWMGWQTAWVSEIEPYACAVLKKRFPDAPNLGDITKIDGTKTPPIDMLVGGFPCQDISLAGKGEGIGGERSGLWKHYARLIEETQPRWVVIENVSALRSRGLGVVLQDLSAIRYDAEWHCIPAAAVGAPHRRDRIWIVAYPNSKPVTDLFSRVRAERSEAAASAGTVAPLESSGGGTCSREQDVADSTGLRVQGLRTGGEQEPDTYAESPVPMCDSEGPRSAAWQAEPNVGRVVDGLPSRVDRVRCLGNAIVPQVAYEIFQAIARYESEASAQ